MSNEVCNVGAPCTEGQNAFPCICRCADSNCTYIQLNSVEHMHTTIKSKPTSI